MAATEKDTQKVIDLAAKTGLFFAKADGEYSTKEEQFIDRFVNKLSVFGPVDDVKANLAALIERHITLEEVVADTKDLLDDFNGLERAMIKGALIQFVKKVIKSDGDKCEAETANFEAWKEAID